MCNHEITLDSGGTDNCDILQRLWKHSQILLDAGIIIWFVCKADMDEHGLGFMLLTLQLVMCGLTDPRSVNCTFWQQFHFVFVFQYWLILLVFSLCLQVNFLHWQEGEPNNFNNDESCAEFRMYSWDETGSWNDANCESYNDWLCQIRAGNISASHLLFSLLWWCQPS